MDVKPRDLIEFEGESKFFEQVSEEMAAFRSRIVDIKESVYRNALDKDREDQWVWMKRFEGMVKIDFLPNDDGAGLEV